MDKPVARWRDWFITCAVIVLGSGVVLAIPYLLDIPFGGDPSLPVYFLKAGCLTGMCFVLSRVIEWRWDSPLLANLCFFLLTAVSTVVLL